MSENKGTTTVTINKPPRAELTMTVKFTKRFHFRLWLGILLFRLGAWVLNWQVTVLAKEPT